MVKTSFKAQAKIEGEVRVEWGSRVECWMASLSWQTSFEIRMGVAQDLK